MKAIQLAEPKSFRVIDVPEPPKPEPGEAVVRVYRVGMCGTDYSRLPRQDAVLQLPAYPGHELGVEVVAVGEGVTNVKPGRQGRGGAVHQLPDVLLLHRGHTNCCENHKTLGVHVDGGLRPLFTVPARKLHVSTKLTFEQLARWSKRSASGCTRSTARTRARTKPSFVIGAGPIGLSVIEFAKLAGARVIVGWT